MGRRSEAEGAGMCQAEDAVRRRKKRARYITGLDERVGMERDGGRLSLAGGPRAGAPHTRERLVTERFSDKESTMYIARWHMKSNPGKTEACIALLRRWEMSVGDRVGLKPGTMRVSVGALGSGEDEIEIDVKVETLSDLESTWKDIEAVPHHKALMEELSGLLVSSPRWSVRRMFELSTND